MGPAIQAQNDLVVVPFPVGAAFNMPIRRIEREHVPFGVVPARNPTLMRLRELEVLEKVADAMDKKPVDSFDATVTGAGLCRWAGGEVQLDNVLSVFGRGRVQPHPRRLVLRGAGQHADEDRVPLIDALDRHVRTFAARIAQRLPGDGRQA